ncbi:MAG: exosortase/archaeosortase family protein [Verrucomicrobiota bacterium]
MESLTKSNQAELLLSGALFFLTVFLFGPATLWLVEQTILHDQLMHAFIILGFAGVYLMMENREKLSLVLSFGNRSTTLLMMSFLVLALTTITHWSPLILIAYCLAIAGWLLFIFGERLARFVLALLSAFVGYVFLALFFPIFDWPLRAMAGQYAAELLNVLGHQVETIIAHSDEPKLLMFVDGYPFEVAAECNGFGMIASCILLSILLVYYRKIAIIDKILAFAFSALIGSIFNLSRILVICLLAPYFRDHYLVMHEIIGNLFFWGALALVWWMVRGLGDQDSRSKKTNGK